MSIATDSKIPTEIDNTWANQDTKQRLLTIEKLEAQNNSNQDLLKRIAHNDEFEEVRRSATMRITDLGELEKLQQLGGLVKESALQQSYRILAGIIETELTEDERKKIIERLKVPARKQIALITKSKTIGSNALEGIKQAEDLADLCLFASSVHVRKSAAQNINDVQLLKEIQIKVTGKDKTVTKVINERLSADVEKPSNLEADIQAKIETNVVTTEPEKPEKTKLKKDPSKPEKIVEPAIELTAIEKEASKLSHKNTIRLYELRAQLRKLLNRIADSETKLLGHAKELHNSISEKVNSNNDYQEQLKSKTGILLITLSEALEAGNSESAIQCWDKIQGNISNTANQVRSSLQNQADVYKAKLTELRDWKIFAATEKKKELIAQMQHLTESRMHASDRSKHISKMHKEWKQLGRSNQNETLWKQFKKLSDLAYEPCKEYFKQRKQLMAENLQKRREICEALEAEHKRLLEEEELNISALNKLLHQAEQDWKRYAPIEQNKIKSLQKRFYATVNQIRKIRKSSLSMHGKQKQALIEQAQALAVLADNNSAMNDAKRLQQEWKKIGPTSYKEDSKYWQEFRAACDKVFSKRNQESEGLRENLKQAEAHLNKLLLSMSELLGRDEDCFREARTEYQDLAQEFSSSLDPRLRSQRKRLLDQFNTLKRQIDSRYKSLPDKKQQLLRNTILQKTKILEQLENSLLAEKDQSRFDSCKQALKLDTWKEIGVSGNSELDKELDTRLKTVLGAKSTSDILELANRSEARFRELCIRAEIRASIETPVEDKPLRMKLQLEQLQSGFGKAKPEPKENIKYALETELLSYTLGPLDGTTRELLANRISQAMQKLR